MSVLPNVYIQSDITVMQTYGSLQMPVRELLLLFFTKFVFDLGKHFLHLLSQM